MIGPPLCSPHPAPDIGLAMPAMRLPIRRILRGDRGIADDQQIFRVPALSRLGNVETAGEDRGSPRQDILIVSQSPFEP